MGRNFPSFRGWLEIIDEDVKRIKRIVRDPRVAKALDEIVDYLHSEAGAVSVSRNPLVAMILLLIAKIMATQVGRDNH